MYIPPISYGWDSNPCAVSVKDVFLTENAHCYRSTEVKQAVDYAMDMMEAPYAARVLTFMLSYAEAERADMSVEGIL